MSKQKKKKKDKQQKKPSQKRTKLSKEQKSVKEPQKKTKLSKKILKDSIHWALRAAALLVTVFGIIQGCNKSFNDIKIVPKSHLSKSYPYTAYFKVENNTWFTINNVQTHIFLDYLEVIGASSQGSFSNMNQFPNPIGSIRSNRGRTTKIEIAPGLSVGTIRKIRTGSIRATVYYETFLPGFQFEEVFYFVTREKPDGTVFWDESDKFIPSGFTSP